MLVFAGAEESSLSLGCLGKTNATIVFYGPNPEPIDKVQGIKGAVMGLYGGEDDRINSKLDELVKALVTYKKPFTMKIFPGAYHAFFNSSRKEHYNEAASKESWDMVLRFILYLRTSLKNKEKRNAEQYFLTCRSLCRCCN